VKKCDDKCTDTHEARHREVNHNDMVVVTLTFLACNKKKYHKYGEIAGI